MGEKEREVSDLDSIKPGSEANEASVDDDTGLPGFNDVGSVTPHPQTAVSLLLCSALHKLVTPVQM